MNTNPNDPRNAPKADDGNLAEDVLRKSGKSEDEVKRTGQIDRADDATENMYGPRGKTVNSPIHRLFWKRAGVQHFAPHALVAEPATATVIANSIGVAKRRRAAGDLYGANGKVTADSIDELGAAGYWGMFVDKEFGGQGAPARVFMPMITQMAAEACPTVAGFASIHGCIGAVDPVRTFGNDAQKKYFLPKLASGETISAFALTEPGAGSDMTALKTTAVLDGEDYVINGEKLFISNAIPGRTIGLVCMVPGENHPAVIIVELPKEENENFQLVNYGIHALKHGYNNGLRFVNFRVPKGNRLAAPDGNGLIIAYHGLNYGRIALCANSAGVMRVLLRSITPESWGKFRRTYGEAIEKRQLVQKRIARLAALIVGADALTDWCSTLLDEGYRGELECIVAKVFGSEAQKEAAIELAMKTHGGRAFLEGHLFGDNIHDFLAPCIYEGEGEMLGMAFFKSLAKEHGLSYMMPLATGAQALVSDPRSLARGPVAIGKDAAVTFFKRFGRLFIGDFKPFGQFFGGVGSLAKHGSRYAAWRAGRFFRSLSAKFGFGYKQRVAGMDKGLQAHVNFALKTFTGLTTELSDAMMKYQVKLADEQCVIAHLSQRTQDALIILVTAMHAHSKGDEVTVRAADILCQDLRRKLTGEQPTGAYFKACSKLAKLVIEGRMTQLNGVPETAVMRTYQQG